jgi:cytochrome c553
LQPTSRRNDARTVNLSNGSKPLTAALGGKLTFRLVANLVMQCGGGEMRHWTIVLLLLATACQQSEAPFKAAETTFDGAQASNVAARIAHGERISWALGCRGCHREKLQGGEFYERYASNLSRDLRNYTDAQIERVLRTGVPHDGRDLWGMPSEIFQHLSKADMQALIADLRSATPTGAPTQPPKP